MAWKCVGWIFENIFPLNKHWWWFPLVFLLRKKILFYFLSPSHRDICCDRWRLHWGPNRESSHFNRVCDFIVIFSILFFSFFLLFINAPCFRSLLFSFRSFSQFRFDLTSFICCYAIACIYVAMLFSPCVWLCLIIALWVEIIVIES